MMIQTNLLSFGPTDTLDPSRLRYVQEYYVLDNVTTKLIQMGQNNEYKNDLAESFNFSDDKRTIDIKLRNDARFSDGSPITSEDVAKSFKRSILFGVPHIDIKNLWLGSEKLTSIDDDIEGIKVLSDKKLQFRLIRPTKEILFFLTITDLAILHKTQYKKKHLLVSDWEEITSGAYKVGYTDQNKIILLANKQSHNFREEMPQKVIFNGYKGENITRQIKDKSLDFGSVTLIDYFTNIELIESAKEFDIVSNKTDGIVHIVLNSKSNVFKKIENRQWIQKRVLENYKINKSNSSVLTKAFQFFLPKAKGHIPNADVLKILKDVDTAKIPEDLKNGLTIRTIEGMKYYLPNNISQKLSDALGIPIKVQPDLPKKRYTDQFDKKRDFDATIMAISMDYKVISEALNLQYLSENPTLLDPTGRIKKLLKDYQSQDDLEKERKMIKQILEQMVYDSESIPIYYFAYPYLIKKSSLESSSINFDEPIKFHKMVVK